MSVFARAIEYVARQLLAEDFHTGRSQQTHYDYMLQAETKINSMTNVELLKLLDTLSSAE